MITLISVTGSFGILHFCGIAILLGLMVATVLLRKKLTLRIWSLALLLTGIFSETIKVFSYIVANEALYDGYLPKTDLPFHLCSIQLVFIAILFFAKKDSIKRIVLSFMFPTCLIGGIAAVCLPTSSSTSMPIIFVQYFVYHAMISSFALWLVLTDKIHFTFKDYLHTLALLGVLGFVAIYLNSMVFDIIGKTTDGAYELLSKPNFMYVVYPPADGLPYLNRDHGWLVYIVHYALLAVFVISLCYIKPIIYKIKGKEIAVEPIE